MSIPTINYDKCVSCGRCVSECTANTIQWWRDKPIINVDECVECIVCQEVCPAGAIR